MSFSTRPLSRKAVLNSCHVISREEGEEELERAQTMAAEVAKIASWFVLNPPWGLPPGGGDCFCRWNVEVNGRIESLFQRATFIQSIEHAS